MADKNPAFAVKPDDPKDVSWGLTTADTCWKRGDRSEALKWLRRAVEAASEAEHDERALELAKVAADLATQIGSMVPPTPGPSAPVVVPRAAPVMAGKPIGARAPSPAVTVKSPGSKETPKKADRKSITNEGPRGRAGHAVDKTTDSLDKTQDNKPAPAAELPPPRKRATSRADRAEARRQSRTDEIDQWPTEVVPGADLPPALGASERDATTDPGVPKATIRACQAVRVLVWKTSDGSVHVAAVGSGRETPLDAIEATLAATEPTADLIALLSAL